MKCEICEIGCRMLLGVIGRCRMYVNENHSIVERFPDTYLSAIPISIETVPMTHYRPRAKFLQVGGIGCNFKCPGCVSSLFTRYPEQFIPALQKYSPEKMVEKALSLGCEGLVFCLNDPVAGHFTFLRLARAARRAGLAVGCSTNLYHTPAALSDLAGVLDFVNCGLKGGSDEAYRQCGALGAGPVFNNLYELWRSGVHVEASIMYLAGQEDEVLLAAQQVAAISSEIPLQVMRFIPFGEASLDLEPTGREAEALCRLLRRNLSFVYLFNSPGTAELNLVCPGCEQILVHREFYGPMGARTIACRPEPTCTCGYQTPIKGEIGHIDFQEKGMSGGYRFTRALEVIRAICGCLGLDREEDLVIVWRSALENEDVDKLHDKINDLDDYLGLVLELGQRFGRENRARALIAHIRGRMDLVAEKTASLARPRVYYAMSTPFFALNAGRFEIKLANKAGGDCVNTQITRSGKPGVNISREELLFLNPQVIFVSGLFSSSEDEFYALCRENALWIEAVNQRRIHLVPPGWDFGNPRWVLGLMHLANILHPETLAFDLPVETDLFYRTFFHSGPEELITNRSFHQPLKARAS